MIKFFVGLDLGQAHDHSAVGILEQELKLADLPINQQREDPRMPISFKPLAPSIIDNTYLLRYLKRYPLGTPYPEIVEHVFELMQEPMLYHYGRLIVDKTGVGAPIVDMLIKKKLRPIAVVITGGNDVVKVQGKREYHVPKADIVSALALLYHSKRIKMSGRLAEAKTLRKEMGDFSYKISRTGHTSYGAEGAGENDDLVLSVGIAAWYALRGNYVKVDVPYQDGADVDEKENEWSPI